MEKQTISVFKQKNRWGLTALCLGLCLLLSPAAVFCVALPQVLAFVPLILLAMLGYVGPVSAFASLAMIAFVCGSFYGMWGGICALLFMLPVLICAGYLVERHISFWKSAVITAAAMFASAGAVVALLTVLAGSDVVTALSGLVEEAFRLSGLFGDQMLIAMMQYGLLEQPHGFLPVMNFGLLSDSVREELIGSLLLVLDPTLRLEIPAQMTVGSIAVGILGQAVLRKGMLKKGVAVEYPPLRTWHLPGGWGRVLGVTFLALFVLASFMQDRFTGMFYIFSGVMDQVLALQGIAALCYLLHSRGRGKKTQGLVFVLGYFVLRSAAVMIGVMDQSFDMTHRREKLGFANEHGPFDA